MGPRVPFWSRSEAPDVLQRRTPAEKGCIGKMEKNGHHWLNVGPLWVHECGCLGYNSIYCSHVTYCNTSLLKLRRVKMESTSVTQLLYQSLLQGGSGVLTHITISIIAELQSCICKCCICNHSRSNN